MFNEATDKIDTPEQAEFRAYCRQWLADNLPAPPTVRLPQSPLEIMTQEQMDYLSDWQKSAYAAGLVGCDYPQEYGGGGRTDCQRVANEEMQAVDTPFFPNLVGLSMAAPTIFYHGSEELKRMLLPNILSCRDIWCQGFSEPDAGSDLANIQTMATLDGDTWTINGQKIWTSLAQFSKWMILIGRHDNSHKHKGLTYFVVPIADEVGKSVEIRPLIKMTGESGFNEVFFTDLKIPDSYRLDEVGNGWKVAMTTLLNERGAGALITPRSGGGGPAGGAAMLADARQLIDLAKQSYRNGKTAIDDPIIRDRIMQQIIHQEGFHQTTRRMRVKGLSDHFMRIPLQYKLLMTESMQAVGALALEIAGASGTLYLNDDHAPDNGQWPLLYMNSYGTTIAAGTSEIHRNIIGEQVLGLPKSK
jgi:alkylation response protein AidB-like acyl-CoA dehydrogenase